MSKDITITTELVVGLDLSDRKANFHTVKRELGCPRVDSGKFALTKAALKKRYGGKAPMTVVLEMGTHSAWVTDYLEELGHIVIVANPRKLPMIYADRKKSDPLDAERLAEVGCFKPKLLSPIKPRPRESRLDLALLRARDNLVRKRGSLVVHVRGLVKPFGERVGTCSTEVFPKRARSTLSPELLQIVEPTLEVIQAIRESIQVLDKKIAELIKKHPHSELLLQVPGVGPLTAIVYLLVVDNPNRFRKCRAVGNYIGLTPRLDESGDFKPELRITKYGDELLRRYLVQASQYILGEHGPDSDLRRWGQSIYERGGRTAKKRAIVAVARKLAVLLCRLWKSGEVYEPLRSETTAAAA